MKNKIFIAFILNLVFAIIEFFGGILTSSVAIMSDSLHDFGDALSIGISALFEKKSQKAPDDTHTYGYRRYSVFGGAVMWIILISGSVIVIVNSVKKIIAPTPLDHDGMIVFAIIGFITNLIAALVTNKGESMNQRAVSLHLLEDTLGWLAVLAGGVIIKLTGFILIDPLLSIALAVFIAINAFKGIKETAEIFLEKVPSGIKTENVKKHLLGIDSVVDIHHLHIRSIDGSLNCATLHAVTSGDAIEVKKAIKKEMTAMGIYHTTVEIETAGEECRERHCLQEKSHATEHHHHHHHHH